MRADAGQPRVRRAVRERVGEPVDRARELEVRLSELITIEDKNSIPLYDKRLDTVVKLLDKVTTRSRILQRALSSFYYGLNFFILTKKINLKMHLQFVIMQ